MLKKKKAAQDARNDMKREKMKDTYTPDQLATAAIGPPVEPPDPKEVERRRAREEMQKEKEAASGRPQEAEKRKKKEDSAKAERDAAREEQRREKEAALEKQRRKEEERARQKAKEDEYDNYVTQTEAKADLIKSQFAQEEIEQTWEEVGSPKRPARRKATANDDELAAARAEMKSSRKRV